MRKEIINNCISDSIERVSVIAENIKHIDGLIPQIDIDLLLENIRSLYQNVIILDNFNSKLLRAELGFDEKSEPVEVKNNQNVEQVAVSEPVQVKTQEVSIPEVEAPISSNVEETESVVESVPNTKYEVVADVIHNDVLEVEPTIHVVEESVSTLPEEPQVVEVVNENVETIEVEIPVEAVVPEVEEVPVENSSSKSEKRQRIEEPTLFGDGISLAEKFEKNERSLNDILNTNKSQSGLNQTMVMSPIDNLKTAIGINDKFMFVNELFKGDMRSYDFFIKAVNETENLEIALGKMSNEFSTLDNKSAEAALGKLETYIRRRFV